jgi:hypothetical protein
MMKAFLGFFSVALVLCALVIFPLYFRSLRKFIELMESNFSSEWEEIGSPRLDMSMNVRSSWFLVRYLWSGHYKRTDSSDVIKYGNQSKFLLMLGLLLFVTFVVVAWCGSVYF